MFNANFCQRRLHLGGPASGPGASAGGHGGRGWCRASNHGGRGWYWCRASNLLGPTSGPAASGRRLGLGGLRGSVRVLGWAAPGPGRGQDGAWRQRNLGLGRPATSPLGWGIRVGLHVAVLPERQLSALLHFVEVLREKGRVARRQLAVGGLYVLWNRRFVSPVLVVQCFQGFHYHLQNAQYCPKLSTNLDLDEFEVKSFRDKKQENFVFFFLNSVSKMRRISAQIQNMQQNWDQLVTSNLSLTKSEKWFPFSFDSTGNLKFNLRAQKQK